MTYSQHAEQVRVRREAAPDDPLAALRALRTQVAAEGWQTFRGWRGDIRRPGFAGSAM